MAAIKNDIHVVRYFTSLITVSNGKVKEVTAPTITTCPVAGTLYPGLKNVKGFSISKLKAAVKSTIENKITRFGLFTKNRTIKHDGTAIPYGASEITAHGLKNKTIDCAVLVCDGAGTVITESPELAQGIGARMNTILKTSAIPEVMRRLRQQGCRIVNKSGAIDQKAGIIEAAKIGYKKIALTISAYGGEGLKDIRTLGKQYGVSITILMICTTGIKMARIKEIEKYADIVWACHSEDVKSRLDKVAIKKLSNISPVYVLTKQGAKLVTGYVPNIYGIRKEIERSSCN